MTGCLPQFYVVYIWAEYFLESTFSVLVLDEVHQCVVDVGTAWLEKARSRRQFVEKEQILFTANFAVIAFGGLFLNFLPFFELFWIGERNTVHTLQ